MPNQKSANAIMAMARAKYGQRISNQQYREMAALPNVTAVVDYLKNTIYAEAIQNSGITNFHRSGLEHCIKTRHIEEIFGLCSFDKNTGSPLLMYFSLWVETEELLRFLRCFKAQKPKDYILSLPSAVNEITTVDLTKLSACQSEGQIIAFFKQYPRYRSVAYFMENVDSTQNTIPIIESLIEKIEYEQVEKVFRQHFSGTDLAEILKLYRLQNEILDLKTIYRAKMFFGQKEDIIKTLLIGKPALLHRETLNHLIAAKNEEEYFNLLSNTKYGKYVKNLNDIMGQGFDRVLQHEIGRCIHFSSNPSTVVFAYICNLTVERMNIFHLVEGVRYQIGQENILKMLALGETEG